MEKVVFKNNGVEVSKDKFYIAIVSSRGDVLAYKIYHWYMDDGELCGKWKPCSQMNNKKSEVQPFCLATSWESNPALKISGYWAGDRVFIDDTKAKLYRQVKRCLCDKYNRMITNAMTMFGGNIK